MMVDGQITTVAAGPTASDTDLLNFALNLAYLKAQFYAFATTGKGIDPKLQGTNPGKTVGGALVTFDNTSNTSTLAAALAADDLAHVQALQTAAAGAAVVMPALALNAVVAMGAQTDFLQVARTLEDITVSAYAAMAPLMQTKDDFNLAAQLLATEAQHAGAVRKLCVEQGVVSAAIDKSDIPPDATHYFSLDATNAEVAARTTAQVLALVYGGATPGLFFPSGFNGNLK
ncbi:MAG TPA: ferritin-like domain-containing protein [Terriglobales bacterium]|nr:ferritin-like domain-containing protein [Terriglobales bacterium]